MQLVQEPREAVLVVRAHFRRRVHRQHLRHVLDARPEPHRSDRYQRQHGGEAREKNARPRIVQCEGDQTRQSDMRFDERRDGDGCRNSGFPAFEQQRARAKASDHERRNLRERDVPGERGPQQARGEKDP